MLVAKDTEMFNRGVIDPNHYMGDIIIRSVHIMPTITDANHNMAVAVTNTTVIQQ